ncbi:MAG: CHAD domain-containing protein [Gemmatimonadetes bacterium]|nr:CHAD domain-containing protein [Gemmatimonadota bacterium]
MITRCETYVLREPAGPDLIETLGIEYSKSLPEKEEIIQYYDTFDWRLYQKGLALIQTGNAVYLQRISDGAYPHDQIEMKQHLEGRFWWMFPEGEVRDTLRGALSVRALLLRAQVRQKVCEFGVLNADEKTVVRLFITHTSTENGRVATLTCRSVRGYERDFENLRCRFMKLDVAHVAEDVFERVMNLAGCVPGDYSSKLNLDLNHKASGREATCEILKYLHGVMRQNESGIRADWDTEFLHDFRVAIRRTRSALSQIKGVLPEDAVAHFKDEFRQLNRSTNRLRDLDVYLLDEETYRAMLPQSLQPGLDAVFSRLKSERRRALSDMVQVLDKPEYLDMMDSWGAFSQGEQSRGGKDSAVPAIALARKFIFKRFKRVLKRGQVIGDDTPDEALHDLRIDCKKLRYLLEFFASLFPKKKMDKLIGYMKKLQDNLGDFNDLSVQQQELMTYLNEVLPRSRRADRLLCAAAIGGLIARLHDQQQAVRREFAGAFAVYAKKKNVRLYRDLFG